MDKEAETTICEILSKTDYHGKQDIKTHIATFMRDNHNIPQEIKVSVYEQVKIWDCKIEVPGNYLIACLDMTFSLAAERET